MANVVETIKGGLLNVQLNNVDWHFSEQFDLRGNRGLKVMQIEVFAAGTCEIFIRDDTATGGVICKANVTSTLNYRRELFGAAIRPFIKISECTLAGSPYPTVQFLLA